MGGRLEAQTACGVLLIGEPVVRSCTQAPSLIQIQHPAKSSLERLKDTPLHVEVSLLSSVTLDVYCSLKDVLQGAGKVNGKMKRGESLPLYVVAANDDK